MEVNQLAFVQIVTKKNLSVNLDIETWETLIKRLEINHGVQNAEECIKKV